MGPEIGTIGTIDSDSIITRYINVPIQKNSADCGIFLLNYAHMFFQNPMVVAQQIEERASFQNWFNPKEMKYSRAKLKEILSSLPGQDAHAKAMSSTNLHTEIPSSMGLIFDGLSSHESKDSLHSCTEKTLHGLSSHDAMVEDDEEIMLIDGFPS